MYLRLKKPCFRNIGSTWLSYVMPLTWCHQLSLYHQYSSLKDLHMTCRKYTFVIRALNVSKQRQKLGNSSENAQCEISQCKVKHWLSKPMCFPYLSFQTKKGCHRSKLLSEFRNLKKYLFVSNKTKGSRFWEGSSRQLSLCSQVH